MGSLGNNGWVAVWPCDLWLLQIEFHLLLGPPFAKPKKKVQMNVFTSKDVQRKTHLQFPSLKHFGVLQRFVTG